MIYLFCNRTFGQAFIERAKELHEQSHIEICIVLSGRPSINSRQPLYKRAIDRVGQYLASCKLSHLLNMKVLMVVNVNSPFFRRRVRPHDHGIVAGFNQIFKGRTIAAFKTLVNFHPSVLPFYRGPVPSHWCIHNGEENTGYTLHGVTEAIDAGQILFQEQIPIHKDDDPELLDRRIAAKAAVTFQEYVLSIVEGTEILKRQLDAATVYKTFVNYASFPSKEQPRHVP